MDKNIKVNFDICFSEEDLQELKKIAKASDISLPDIIRKSLKIWLTAKANETQYTLALVDSKNLIKIKYKNI